MFLIWWNVENNSTVSWLCLSFRDEVVCENLAWFIIKCSINICHYFITIIPMLCCVLYLAAQSCPTCCNPMDCSPPSSSAAAAAAKSLQSCPTLCDPISGSPPGSPIPGILQARTLEWVAISFSNAWKWKVKVKLLVVSDSSRPHGLQSTRLLRPWDFPGKSTGVRCHCFLAQAPLVFNK